MAEQTDEKIQMVSLPGALMQRAVDYIQAAANCRLHPDDVAELLSAIQKHIKVVEEDETPPDQPTE